MFTFWASGELISLNFHDLSSCQKVVKLTLPPKFKQQRLFTASSCYYLCSAASHVTVRVTQTCAGLPPVGLMMSSQTSALSILSAALCTPVLRL